MKVGIAGWFGSDNLGDEILLHSLITCVRSVAEDATFVVLCPDPGRVTALHRVCAQHMPTVRSPGTAAGRSATGRQSAAGDQSAVGRQGAARRAIRACDILLLGPGTVFQERSPSLSWPGTLPLFVRMLGMARLAGTPVAAVGVGVREGGTPLGRQLLRLLGSACVAVGARDRRSASCLGRGAQVVGDMAYALSLPAHRHGTPDQRFAVSMRPLDPGTEGPLLASVSGCVDRLHRDGWSGVFLPMAFGWGARGEDDREIYHRALRDTMDVAANPLTGDGPLAAALDSWLATLGTFRLVIGARLHAAVLAVALGVPTVAVAYERKVHDAFVDLKLDRFVVRPDVDSRTLHRTATMAAASAEEFQDASARIARQGGTAREFVASVLRGLG